MGRALIEAEHPGGRLIGGHHRQVVPGGGHPKGKAQAGIGENLPVHRIQQPPIGRLASLRQSAVVPFQVPKSVVQQVPVALAGDGVGVVRQGLEGSGLLLGIKGAQQVQKGALILREHIVEVLGLDLGGGQEAVLHQDPGKAGGEHGAVAASAHIGGEVAFQQGGATVGHGVEHQEVVRVHTAHPAVLGHVHAPGSRHQGGGGGVEFIAVGIDLDAKLGVGGGVVRQLQGGDAPVVPLRRGAYVGPDAVHIGLTAGVGLPPAQPLQHPVPGGGDDCLRRVDPVGHVVGVGGAVLVDQQVFPVKVHPTEGRAGHVRFPVQGHGGPQRQVPPGDVPPVELPVACLRPISAS